MSVDARSSAVEVEALQVRFGHFVAVDAISFEVAGGEVFGFLGPNGSGKSTTIRVLCGLLVPSGGQARVIGFDVAHQAEQVRRRMGYMPQFFSLYPDLTVSENILFYAGMYGVPDAAARERLQWLSQRLGLGEVRERLAGTLSTGWRQRLALAASIVHSPPLLFLDEPTSGVDPITRRLFWEVIDDLAHEGTTIFVTTHVMDEAEHCTRLAMMHRGKLIAQGTPTQLRGMVQHLVEVRAEPLWEALAALEADPRVVEVALFGDALHAECAATVEDPAACVRQALLEAGLTVTRAQAIEPTMEDVFVSLARMHDRVAQDGEAR